MSNSTKTNGPNHNKWREQLTKHRLAKVEELLNRFEPLRNAYYNEGAKAPVTLDDYYSVSHLCWLAQRLKTEPLADAPEFYMRYGFLLGLCVMKFGETTADLKTPDTGD